ncbi:hypothetical protein JM78_13190 [Burkholderia pyrrocinia]|nr:hypothetical protein JM78_13190 [Burkholderia pyrrocinia]
MEPAPFAVASVVPLTLTNRFDVVSALSSAVSAPPTVVCRPPFVRLYVGPVTAPVVALIVAPPPRAVTTGVSCATSTASVA